MHLQVALVVLISSGLNGQNHGPVFLLEPPGRLTFSNTTGSQVSCSAHGSPNPQVDWLLQNGNVVTAVPGLRQLLGNGTLYFPSFRAQDYRKDVHYTVYRCKASNSAGTILSRDVNVRAVVTQHYEVQVYHTHVLAGNTAVLGCVIPASVREYVAVTSWSRDETILLPGSNLGGRLIVTYGTGELHIRSARSEDGLFRYSCLTIHILTQERKRSGFASLTVTGSMPPRLTPALQTTLSADRESDIHLSCSAQGNPPPNFIWFRELDNQMEPIYSSSRYEPLQDVLLIRNLKPEDSGRWICKVSNQFGDQRIDIHLTVIAHISVHVLPQLQVINSGENAIFNCTISGSPMGRVHWLKNGESLSTDMNGRVRSLSALVLSIAGITRHDKGMYQCIVQNDWESAQGSAELRLGDTIPELQYTFIEQALRPGPQVSLRCSATGSPPPKFKWLLDGEILSELKAGQRFTSGQYVDSAGDVISHWNISNVKVEDGGLYSCRAVNSLGSAQHSARLNIYGAPFIRSIGPVKAVAGSDVTLHCPYSGYPIESVRWERNGQQLPLDIRHRLNEAGSLMITSVYPATDPGFYTCYVTSRDGDVVRRDIQLIVHSPPVLEPFSFPTSLQEGSRAQVTCYVTSGDMPIHFAWNKDGAPISASLQVEQRTAEFYSMLIFKEVSSTHTGAYTCVASNLAALANYTAHLMVKVPPQWVVEPQDTSILLGNSLMVNCLAKGYPHPQITWLRALGKTSTDFQSVLNVMGRIVLLANGSMWLEIATSHDEGPYLCRATNGIGSGLSKIIHIEINEPARFETAVKNVTVKRGHQATLLCHVYGDNPIELQWTHNGKRLEMNNYRLSETETRTENGFKFHIIIGRTERDDSGVYKCQAENVYGRSDHIINLMVQEQPDPPSALEVVEVTSRSVRLSWRRPYDGNSPILGYLVQHEPLNQENWDQQGALNVTLPVTPMQSYSDDLRETAMVTGLFPATAYSMRMLALNSIDQSAFTETVIVKTQEEAPSDPPKDVYVNSTGAEELFVSWTVPSRKSWNGELLGYIVTWNEQGKPSNNSKTLTVKGWATIQVQLLGLQKFTRYAINVRAFNAASSGPPSLDVTGVTREGVPEAPPQDVKCSQISAQSMKVSWSPPPVAYHGGNIQGYKIYYRPVSNDDDDVFARGEIKRTTSIETYLHGLHKYTNYSIKVLAYTGTGDGTLSPSMYCTTEEDVPDSPASIKAAALTGESIIISWLPPTKPNGRIIHYIVYVREAGRVGKHSSYPVRVEDLSHLHGLMYEIRNLAEHQLYEFWVSATTLIGEGEPTALVAQATDSRAPSRIVSFSQIVHKAINSKIVFPCVAVGNPTPRTRWIYKEKPITFSVLYEITSEGHLHIHRVDQSLAGNYSCSAKNIYGEDKITYTLSVLLPPGAPILHIHFTTSKSIKLYWTQPEDGGAVIQGYTLYIKHDADEWTLVEVSPEHTVYTYDGLRCGSKYEMYLVAYNRVGKGNRSPTLASRTVGGPPKIPREKDFISTNSTSLQLNLFNWPDGGCPISHFSIQYKSMRDDEWLLVSNSVPREKLIIQDLTPATWYHLRIIAKNDAGICEGNFRFSTATLSGGRVPMPPNFSQENEPVLYYPELYIISAIACVVVLLIFASSLWFAMVKRTRNLEENQTEDAPQDEKSTERDNRRNCQQVYTATPLKTGDKISNEAAAMYEISPYATFNVAGNNSHSVTSSTLDYTMQFKTFGHIENDEHNAMISKNFCGKRNWYKRRYFNENEGNQQTRLRGMHVDSESEDTSESPCGECPGDSNYRVPVKTARDPFRPDSSTESNDLSPVTHRRQTPRHVGPPRMHHHPSSTSSSGEEHFPEETNVRLLPPHGFSDNHEMSEAECDRDLKPNRFPVELTSLLTRYQERKEQERKGFTIHV